MRESLDEVLDLLLMRKLWIRNYPFLHGHLGPGFQLANAINPPEQIREDRRGTQKVLEEEEEEKKEEEETPADVLGGFTIRPLVIPTAGRSNPSCCSCPVQTVIYHY